MVKIRTIPLPEGYLTNHVKGTVNFITDGKKYSIPQCIPVIYTDKGKKYKQLLKNVSFSDFSGNMKIIYHKTSGEIAGIFLGEKKVTKTQNSHPSFENSLPVNRTIPLPKGSSTDYRTNLKEFKVGDEFFKISINVLVQYTEGGKKVEDILENISFWDFTGSMKIVYDTKGDVEKIILGEKKGKENKNKDRNRYGREKNLPTNRINTTPANIGGGGDSLLQAVNKLVKLFNQPDIISTPPDYSGPDNYRENEPIIEYYIKGRNNRFYDIESQIPTKNQKEKLLEMLKTKGEGNKKYNPIIIGSIVQGIDRYMQNNLIQKEFLFNDFFSEQSSSTRLLLFHFFIDYFYSTRKDDIILNSQKKLLLEYNVDGEYPYKEIKKIVESQEQYNGEKILLNFINTIRSIPVNDRISFLYLLSNDSIIEDIRKIFIQKFNFKHEVFRNLESIDDSSKDNILKNIEWLELSDGCSVGCPFCAAGANPKSAKKMKYFNASDIILLAAKYAGKFSPTLYDGTDPLDWEEKIGDETLNYFDLHNMVFMLTGNLPYISTAVPKNKKKLAVEYAPIIDRISLSYWNESWVKGLDFSELGTGLVFADRSITPANKKAISWVGIPDSKAKGNYKEFDINAWSPTCSHGIKITPSSAKIVNTINLAFRDKKEAPHGDLFITLEDLNGLYLSKEVTLGEKTGDLNIIKNLMKGSIVLSFHKDSLIFKKTEQFFGKGSFLLKTLGFDGKKRYYVYVYNYLGKNISALVYMSFEEYSKMYFSATEVKINAIDKPKPKQEIAIKKKKYTAHEVLDEIKKGNIQDIIEFIYENQPSPSNNDNLSNCHFTEDEIKILLIKLIETLSGGIENKHSWTIEKIIKYIMFNEEYNQENMLGSLTEIKQKYPLGQGIMIQLDAAIDRLSGYPNIKQIT